MGKPSATTILLLCVMAIAGASAKVPVIIDTDIGIDMDDSWALMLSLAAVDEVDVKLVVTDQTNPQLSTQLTAKFLYVLNRTDIPIGVGLPGTDRTPKQATWSQNFDMSTYPGTVLQDGVQAIIDTVKSTPADQLPVTIMALAPMPNIETALARDPSIAPMIRMVLSGGSFKTGYCCASSQAREYNIVANVSASRSLFDAPWSKIQNAGGSDVTVIMAPLDITCNSQISGSIYQQLMTGYGKNRMVTALIESYQSWVNAGGDFSVCCPLCPPKPMELSTVLYDVVAATLAWKSDYMNMQWVDIELASNGLTNVVSHGTKGATQTWSAVGWNADGETQWSLYLVDTLLSWTPPTTN